MSAQGHRPSRPGDNNKNTAFARNPRKDKVAVNNGARTPSTDGGGHWLSGQRGSVTAPEINSSLRLPEGDPSVERLFNTHPRIVPFTHRPIYSVRHPFVRHTTLDHGVPKRRRGKSIHEDDIMSRLKCKNPVTVQQDEYKWVELGHLFDAISSEDEVAKRRQDIACSAEFQAGVDELWGKAEVHNGLMTKSCYMDITCVGWKLFVSPFCDHGSDQFKVMIRGAEADYQVDAHPTDNGVDFGTFTVSILELVDNWAESTTHSAYITCLQIIAKSYTPAGQGVVTAPTPAPIPTPTWTEKKTVIQKHYNAGLFDFLPPSISKLKRRPNSNLCEYHLVPPPAE
eukprot:TRINITY_DN23740_c0_g1_i1.p1 TRINITY_DN23740_c0_g1~~TRINITY_DN23740_c0_g1_i1.p1  ORF type:complete len:340 (+),score=41.67 TRINITY_DN23740_c0_g1_i1:106-1125(+)